MREILFRGKTEKAEWVEGGLLYDEEQNEAYIAEHFEDKSAYLRPIIPETVGQYTGLTDNNGKKIFEGDIVEGLDFTAEDGGYGIVTFDDGAFEVVGSCDNIIVGTFHENYYGKDFEVIGNIHDNPELLGGTE